MSQPPRRDTGRLMMELLRKRSAQPDQALVVVTHDSRILQFGDRSARMDHGKMVEIMEDSEAGRLE